MHQTGISGAKSLARGETPLHWAAEYGKAKAEVVKLLVEAKTSVTVKNNSGRGPRLGDVMGVCLLCAWQLSVFADC